MSSIVRLTGRDLTLKSLEDIAVGEAQVEIAGGAHDVMRRSRSVVETYLREGIPAYGLNTGLGAKVTDMLPRQELEAFSYRMVRGRAQGVGEPLAREAARAVVTVRLNTLLSGAAGQSEGLADFLAQALNRGFTPVMPRQASIGAADLVAMAALPLSLIGEGEALVEGRRVRSSEALAACGLAPLALGPRDGHLLCNNTAFTVGRASLVARAAERSLLTHIIACGCTFEGFRGNATPLLEGVLAIRPHAGARDAGRHLRMLLEGGLLLGEGEARRLQDPLSLRCAAQTFGASLTQLRRAGETIQLELNSSGDNPAVLPDDQKILTTGNFHLAEVTVAMDGLARSLAWSATDGVSRIARLLNPGFSGLPPLLSSTDAGRAGFGPLMKIAEALRAEIIHQSAPVPVMPSHNADGQEDSAPLAPLAVEKLDMLLRSYDLLIALELIAGAQAIDLAKSKAIGTRLRSVHRAIRSLSPFIEDDRPLGADIEEIAAKLVRSGSLLKTGGLQA